MPFCPNCSAELKVAERYPPCWNCEATFTGEGSWKPLSEPKGAFRPFPKREGQGPRLPSSESHPLVSVFLRLIVACLGSAALLVLAALSAMPYGGGSQTLFSLWGGGSIVLLIWAFLPLGRLGSQEK